MVTTGLSSVLQANDWIVVLQFPWQMSDVKGRLALGTEQHYSVKLLQRFGKQGHLYRPDKLCCYRGCRKVERTSVYSATQNHQTRTKIGLPTFKN